MRCQLIRVDGLGWAYVCGGKLGPICRCGRPAGYRCDGPGCDKPLCARHRHGHEGGDFCTPCWQVARRRPGAQLSLFEEG